MPWFSINTAPLIEELLYKHPKSKMAWQADDTSAAGKLEHLASWYENMVNLGRTYGYLVNPEEYWLILKTQDSQLDARGKELCIFIPEAFYDTVNITCEGKRHLASVLNK